MKFIIIILLHISFSIFLIAQGISSCSSTSCPNNRIDMSKMLQYKEKIIDTSLYDRFGKEFNMKRFDKSPILLTILRDDNDLLLNYDKNLQKKLSRYIKKGLKLVYIIAGLPKNKDFKKRYKSIDIYFDKEPFPLLNLFKINYHESNIILNSKHETILSSISIMNSTDLEEIISGEEIEIFK